jgi:hypothetical protein
MFFSHRKGTFKLGLLALGKLPKLIVFFLLYERLESVELIDAKDRK